jgi:hypothetical protein
MYDFIHCYGIHSWRRITSFNQIFTFSMTAKMLEFGIQWQLKKTVDSKQELVELF